MVPPGEQSFTVEFNAVDDSVIAAIPTTFVLLNDDKGILASTLTNAPLVHTTKLQLCCAAPLSVSVPMGYSNCVVGIPELLNCTHNLASITPFPVVEINAASVSLLILLVLDGKYSSQRTYRFTGSEVIYTCVKSPDPPPASVPLSMNGLNPVQSVMLPSMMIFGVAVATSGMLIPMRASNPMEVGVGLAVRVRVCVLVDV